MEDLTKYTPCTYIDRAYKFIRNSLLNSYVKLVFLKIIVICFLEFRDEKQIFDILVPVISMILFIPILNLESHKVPTRHLLFLISEIMNIDCYIFGLYITSDQPAIYIILSTISTCGFQLVGSSKFENNLIIFKLLFVWFILPILLGTAELPNEQTTYLTIPLIFLMFSTLFTSRKELEDEYLLAIQTIQKMKQQLSNIIQAMPETVLIFSESQRVLLTNRECHKVFQAGNLDEIREKLIGIRYSASDEAPDKSLITEIYAYINSDVEQGITFGISEMNGRSYEWRGAKSEWDQNKIIILSARDITSLISYERAKAEAESKNILLRTVSHEIRTPANTISALSEALIESNLPRAEDMKIRIINISSKLLINLMNDLLDFSRMVAECFTINKFEINLPVFIKETYTLFSVQAEQKMLDYRYFIDPLLPTVIISDPNRLRQIIINLLSNALKFTLQGKIRLEAFLTENSNMLIKVSDTGLGIPPHKIDHLFQAFNTTQDIRINPQGCGLGLFISNKLAQMLGSGSIHVKSKLHEGSEFSFDVDIGVMRRISIEISEGEFGEENISDERYSEAVPRNIITHKSFLPIQPNVIIVDDNEFNLLIMRNFLTSAGYIF
jgi:signal transduction histidine kinase